MSIEEERKKRNRTGENEDGDKKEYVVEKGCLLFFFFYIEKGCLLTVLWLHVHAVAPRKLFVLGMVK